MPKMVEAQAQKVDEGATALDAEAAETPELRTCWGNCRVNCAVRKAYATL